MKELLIKLDENTKAEDIISTINENRQETIDSTDIEAARKSYYEDLAVNRDDVIDRMKSINEEFKKALDNEDITDTDKFKIRRERRSLENTAIYLASISPKLTEDFDFNKIIRIEDGPGGIELMSGFFFANFITEDETYTWSSTQFRKLLHILEDSDMKTYIKNMWDEYEKDVWENF